MAESEKKFKEKTQKDEYTAQLARRIGAHLLKKLSKTLRKNLRIKLNALKNPEAAAEEEEAPESGVMSESELPDDPRHVKAYPQLRPLVREERSDVSSKPQKFFDLLVNFETGLRIP